MKIYVLHENDAWVEPLRTAFADLDLPFEEWFLDRGTVALDEEPPDGVFYNRMSASSHTRGHRYAPELTHAVLHWLERHGRRVVNGSRALSLEVSKVAQYRALADAGVRVPRTIAAVGRDAVLDAARRFGDGPFILKPNRGGKGLGVERFDTVDAAAAFLDTPDLDTPLDGIWLVQEYLRAAEPFITRCEIVGGSFLYAVRVDTQDGAFELCPADVCTIETARAAFEACPIDSASAAEPNKFTILDQAPPEGLIAGYVRALEANGVEVAGLEFIVDADGNATTYDINTNTNYNALAEEAAGVPMTGMQAIARYLGAELAKVREPVHAS